jgi:hypothetical protein
VDTKVLRDSQECRKCHHWGARGPPHRAGARDSRSLPFYNHLRFSTSALSRQLRRILVSQRDFRIKPAHNQKIQRLFLGWSDYDDLSGYENFGWWDLQGDPENADQEEADEIDLDPDSDEADDFAECLSRHE